MGLNTGLCEHTANFPHLQDGNLGPDPAPSADSEKTSTDVNGPWKKALFKFSNVSKSCFSTDKFPLVITPTLTSELECTLNKLIYFSFSSNCGRFFMLSSINWHPSFSLNSIKLLTDNRHLAYCRHSSTSVTSNASIEYTVMPFHRFYTKLQRYDSAYY